MPSPARLSLLPCLLASALVVGGCHGRFEEAWPDTGGRRFSGLLETREGERVAIGHWTFWYPDGVTKQAQGWFDGGALPDLEADGPGRTLVPTAGRTKKWSFWDEDGLILSEGYYTDGARDDLWACWTADGELCCTGPFEAGRPEGFHVTWAGGQRIDEHYYVDGVLHGPRVVRDASGQPVWEGEYRAGQLVAGSDSAPEPPLHRLEACANAAEGGEHPASSDHVRR